MTDAAPGSGAGHDPFEDLVASFVERQRRGEHPSVDDYVERHPEHSAQIREFFPLLQILEDRTSTADESRPPPEVFGEFRLIREIGRGGMGVVYEAEQTALRRRVAIKVMAGAGAVDPARWERFRREAEVASRLDHPGICAVHGAGIIDGTPYLAMRYIEGHDLGLELAAAGALTLPEAASDAAGTSGGIPASSSTSPGSGELWRRIGLVEEVARAVHAAHEAGILHRDLKPGNVMVTPDGHAVILDFGLARDLLADQTALTRPGDVCGTPAYLAPEQIASPGARLDRRTDIYALGVILYECATGRRPFAAPTRDALYHAILEDEPPAPRLLNRAVPKDLATIVQTAMAKDAADRYQTAADLAEDLQRARRREPVSVRPLGPVARTARWARRHPRRAAAAAAFLVVLAVAAALGGYVWAGRKDLEAGRRQARTERLEALLEEGYFQHSEGSLERAREAFDEVLTIEPGRIEALNGLVMVSESRGDPERALEVIDGEATRSGTSPALARLKASLLRRLKRSEEAAAIERTLPPPASAAEWFLIGTSRMPDCHVPASCDFPGAVEAFRRATLLTERAHRLYHFGLTHAAGHARDAGTAREMAETLAVLWPDSTHAAYHRGLARMHLGELAAALDGFRAALALRPGHGPSLMGVAEVHLERGELDAALAAAKNAVSRIPGDARAVCNLGRVHDRRGELAEAIACFRKVSEVAPEFALAWETLGSALFRHGEPGPAESAFREALKRRPRLASTWIGLAQALIHLGRPADAAAAARSAIDIEHDHPEGLRVLALALLQIGEAGEAVACAERAARAAPDNALAWLALGRAHLLNRDAAAALDAVRRALALEPGHAAAHFTHGYVLQDTGELDAAVAEFEVARTLDSAFADPCCAIAEIRLGQKRPVEAEAAAREAIRRKPDIPEAWCNLGHALRAQGRYVEALAAFRHGHELGSRLPSWSHPSARWIEEADALAGLEERLAALRDRGEAAGSAAEAADLAPVAGAKKLYALESRLWGEAMAAGPAERARHRLSAARAAFLAALGEGADSGTLPESDRVAHSKLARELIAEFLSAMDPDSEARPADAGRLERALRRWLDDPALVDLRQGNVPADLPVSEREAWRPLLTLLESLVERDDH